MEIRYTNTRPLEYSDQNPSLSIFSLLKHTFKMGSSDAETETETTFPFFHSEHRTLDIGLRPQPKAKSNFNTKERDACSINTGLLWKMRLPRYT